MMSNTAINRLRLVFHSVGLSCLGGAIFIQVLVFTNILQQGYFRAIENNSTILSLELCLTAFTVVYFLYFYQREIRSFLKR
ncbi:MAG: hypothetical protein ACQCN6_12250 [Candidatus Bathyarchaeia archaeon]